MFGFKKSTTFDSIPQTTEIKEKPSYKDRLRDSIFWNLSTRRPFIINDEYKIDLLHIDFDSYTARIRVTNLKNQTVTETTIESDYE